MHQRCLETATEAIRREWQKNESFISKPIKASASEIERNPRARSALMRVAEKIA